MAGFPTADPSIFWGLEPLSWDRMWKLYECRICFFFHGTFLVSSVVNLAIAIILSRQKELFEALNNIGEAVKVDARTMETIMVHPQSALV